MSMDEILSKHIREQALADHVKRVTATLQEEFLHEQELQQISAGDHLAVRQQNERKEAICIVQDRNVRRSGMEYEPSVETANGPEGRAEAPISSINGRGRFA
jgi:hypothetical protein